MELFTFTLALISPAALLNILIVALGLGLVIFFHELGHFLVAKWCGVYVERFSIGFGAPILSWKWGETEYALGWLPFGGYVKMLGQDDVDPGQMTDENIAENPRSYPAKTVPQRMAIISAGVIMNVLTGTLFFVLVFSWGIMKTDRVIGGVQPGMPAWTAGIRAGDTITSINGKPVREFDDLLRRTVLSSGSMTISGTHADGEEFRYTLTPEQDKIKRLIGASPAESLKVISRNMAGDLPVALPGTAAADSGIEFGDTVVAANGTPITDMLGLLEVLGNHQSEPVTLSVLRKVDGEERETDVEVPAQPFLDFGLKLSMGQIVALQDGSIGKTVGLKVGDRITKLNGLDVETDLDPIRLSEFFSDHAGEEVTMTVTRKVEGSSPETHTITVVPEDEGAYSEPPLSADSPLAIPSIGVAYQLVPKVFSVVDGSPASDHNIQPRDTIVKMELVRKEGAPKDLISKDVFELDIKETNWPYAFWQLQQYGRTRHVKLTVRPSGATENRVVELKPTAREDWFMPTTRGITFQTQQTKRQAEDLGQAVTMGAEYTLSSMQDIYLTLRGLFTRDISPKGLSGPIGIARVAYSFANVGWPHFVLFLGIISINLAVINFLPIPVLDGGHMVFLLWEGLARRKPSEKVVATATYCGLAFVLGLMLFVIYLDIFEHGWGR